MKLLYESFIILYPLIARILSLKNKKARLWVNGRKDLFARLRNQISATNGDLVWIHCASLGEYEQGLPFIEAIKKQYPRYQLLVTFFSPSGYEIKKNISEGTIISYLPMDSATNAKKFLAITKPKLILFIKYEYWYHYLKEAKRQSIPLLLVSGIFRPNQPFFKFYGNFHRKMLSFFDYLFVQNQESAQLLNKIGFNSNVSICGDSRFDRVLTIANQFQPIPSIESFINQNPLIIVAGSTWKEDDEVLAAFASLHPDYKLIIAPHHIDKERIDACIKMYPNAIRYTDFLAVSEDKSSSNIHSKKIEQNEYNVLIINNIGMLSKLYAYASFCYVGGGFGTDGVHNVLEAAVYFKPVIIGPEFSKYDEAKGLVEKGGCFSISDVQALETIVLQLESNKEHLEKASKAAGSFVKNNAGATDRILNHLYINRLLTN